MLNKISVNVLLKSVIAILAVAVVIALSLSAWSSWSRLVAVNRIAIVADASSDLFTALHNLRVDRASTSRDLNSDKQLTTLSPQLKQVRDADMPALKSALTKLETADFPGRQSAVTSLSQAIQKLTALHQESAAAIALPKSAPPQGLAQEYFKTTTALMELLDNISTQLTMSVNLSDSYVDQLMELKQLGWMVRNAGGDASVMISNALGGIPLPPDAMSKYTANVAQVETAWAALESLATGLPLPAYFSAALDKAKREYFGTEYTDLRLKTLKALIAGEKIAAKADDWSQMSVAKLASLLGVAEAALKSAKEYASVQRAEASWTL
jgi:methyl-accepting chemotaxis protein